MTVKSTHPRHGAAPPSPSRDLTREVQFLTRALKSRRCGTRSPDWQSAPGRSHAHMRSSSSPACSGRSPLGSATAGRAESTRHGCRARKSLEESDFDDPRGLKLAHPGTLDFVVTKETVRHFRTFSVHRRAWPSSTPVIWCPSTAVHLCDARGGMHVSGSSGSYADMVGERTRCRQPTT